MKRLLILLSTILTVQISFGQACGIYRIKYTGKLTFSDKKIEKIFLPTTVLLHGLENESLERSYIETQVTNETFNIVISSHLTQPYNDIKQLISLYKKHNNNLRIKVALNDSNRLKDVYIEVNWDDILVSIIDDGKFGTLFEFKIKEQFL